MPNCRIPRSSKTVEHRSARVCSACSDADFSWDRKHQRPRLGRASEANKGSNDYVARSLARPDFRDNGTVRCGGSFLPGGGSPRVAFALNASKSS
jgi:hypothetical protein